jgi:hypothetical protein
MFRSESLSAGFGLKEGFGYVGLGGRSRFQTFTVNLSRGTVGRAALLHHGDGRDEDMARRHDKRSMGEES